MAKGTAREMIEAMDRVVGVKSKALVEASKPQTSKPRILDAGLERERKFYKEVDYEDAAADTKAIWLAERADIMNGDKNLARSMPRWIERIFWDEFIATRERAVDSFKTTHWKKIGKKDRFTSMEKRRILQGDAVVQAYERWVFKTHMDAIEAYKEVIKKAYQTNYAEVQKLPE